MIAVLDFGSQYTHLITRRLRELGVYSEIFPHDISKKELPLDVKGIIISGGPNSVYEKDAPLFDKTILENKVPVLGICYGHQLIAHTLGGQVLSGDSREYGSKIINVKGGKLLKGLKRKEQVWFSHGDVVLKTPSGFTDTARSGRYIVGFENSHIFGVQFHPEVAHTPHGGRILTNFINICKENRKWRAKNRLLNLVSEVKKTVRDKSVLIGVSGGIDSLVAAMLIKKAVGKNLYCAFVDTGLMRKNEPDQVVLIYRKLGFKNFISYDASKKFLKVLKGVKDPEEKRKRIGYAFINVFEKISRTLKRQSNIEFLAQGTIYPDRIESSAVGKSGVKIKSHHNLTLPQKLKFQLIEPLRDFYKDEVRSLGRELGIPVEFLTRHPFPGPGLAIRVLGKITQERLKILKEADYIFIEELVKAKLYNKIWQAFAALLPVKTVGVMGDSRTYEYIISLRAVTSRDGMTADWAKIPQNVLEKISARIVNEAQGVNRVVYDITQKPPATIEYE